VLLADQGGALPEVAKRLIYLAKQERKPDPQRMGLGSLLHVVDIDPQDTDKGLVYKNLHALIGDFMDTFSVSVLPRRND
jgi:hypothetical protein